MIMLIRRSERIFNPSHYTGNSYKCHITFIVTMFDDSNLNIHPYISYETAVAEWLVLWTGTNSTRI